MKYDNKSKIKGHNMVYKDLIILFACVVGFFSGFKYGEKGLLLFVICWAVFAAVTKI